MFRPLSIFGSLVVLAFVGCNADLADGNPCHAILHAYCDRAERCNLLPAGATDSASCLSQAAGQPFNANCSLSASSARTCSSDIDASGCQDLQAPGSCSPAFDFQNFENERTVLPWETAPDTSTGGSSSSFGGSSSSFGGRSSGGTGGKSTGGSGGSGHIMGSAGFGAFGGSGGVANTSDAGVPIGDTAPFVGTWSGTVTRDCVSQSASCPTTQVTFQADVTQNGSGLLVVTPGTYDSMDPPAGNDCAPVSLFVMGSVAQTNGDKCVSAALGPVAFDAFRLELISSTSMSIAIKSEQSTPFAYTLDYSGTLTRNGFAN
ncbi:MAG TPA: hypothetical protein VNW92_07145 [Polyangiaceae bacterium]|nr:hypothetical protein [Polyangiaceae bacterium]